MRSRALLFVTFLLLCAAPGFGQSCAMCYGSAKATSKEGQKAINKGVIVLLVPPFGFLTVGFWMAFRYGKKRDSEHQFAMRFSASDDDSFVSPSL